MMRCGFRSPAALGALAVLSVAALALQGCSEPISPVDNWPFVVVAGTVTRANGEPAASAHVRVDLRMPSCSDGLFTFATKTTDAQGRYAVNLEGAGPSEGCVRVRVTPIGAEPVFAEEPQMDLVPGRPPADTIWISVIVP